MIKTYEVQLSNHHSIKWLRISLHLQWFVILSGLVSACVDNRPYLGLLNYILLGAVIILLCVMREDILWYKLYRTIKELEKC